MAKSELTFDNSALVVAHPDDEILWFSSIIDRVSKIIICFLESEFDVTHKAGRQKSLEAYPIGNISCLGLKESKSFDTANWKQAEYSGNGLVLHADKSIIHRYEENYSDLVKALMHELGDVEQVFTHNPWGEYGHEEHVQVSCAVTQIQADAQFNIWYSNYCSNKSLPLAMSYISGFKSNYHTLKTNKVLSNQIMDIYKKNNCWTWFDEYDWFNEECFISNSELRVGSIDEGHMFPFNFIRLDLGAEEEPALYRRIINKIFSRV